MRSPNAEIVLAFIRSTVAQGAIGMRPSHYHAAAGEQAVPGAVTI